MEDRNNDEQKPHLEHVKFQKTELPFQSSEIWEMVSITKNTILGMEREVNIDLVFYNEPKLFSFLAHVYWKIITEAQVNEKKSRWKAVGIAVISEELQIEATVNKKQFKNQNNAPHSQKIAVNNKPAAHE